MPIRIHVWLRKNAWMDLVKGGAVMGKPKNGEDYEHNQDEIKRLKKENGDYEFILSAANGMTNSNLKARFINLIVWYVKKANLYKWSYYILGLFMILLPPIIVILNNIASANQGLPIQTTMNIGVTILAAIATIISGAMAFFKLHENWILYRKSAESIKNRVSLYLVGAHPYDSQKKRDIKLIEDIEKIVLEENNQWISMQSNNDEENKKLFDALDSLLVIAKANPQIVKSQAYVEAEKIIASVRKDI